MISTPLDLEAIKARADAAAALALTIMHGGDMHGPVDDETVLYVELVRETPQLAADVHALAAALEAELAETARLRARTHELEVVNTTQARTIAEQGDALARLRAELAA